MEKMMKRDIEELIQCYVRFIDVLKQMSMDANE